jgi:hypothetical protein
MRGVTTSKDRDNSRRLIMILSIKVRCIFQETAVGSISYTSFSRPTGVSRVMRQQIGHDVLSLKKKVA